MQETIKMMKSIIIGKEYKLTEQELLIEYQEKLSPNILAFMFINNIGIISRTFNLYTLIDEQDKISICLQELDKCLQRFDYNKECKFITYFIKCLKNRLRTQTQYICCQKRSTYLHSDELDNSNIKEDTYELFSLEDYGFTNMEKCQLELLINGYSIKEIANKLKLSISYIYQKNQKIKEKILNRSIKIYQKSYILYVKDLCFI